MRGKTAIRPLCSTSAILRALLGGLLLCLGTAGTPAGAATAIDPERGLSQPTDWQWLTDRSEAQINALRAEGWRLVDLEVERHSPTRFATVFVRNSGPQARAGQWWFGISAARVIELTRDEGRRPIDLESYMLDGRRRYAIVTVRNRGTARKGWRMAVGQVPAGINIKMRRFEMRPIDIDTYVVNGVRRYSFIAINNRGVDARSWAWYHNVTPEFVQEKLEQHRARLIDIERPSEGKLTVVMVRNKEGVFTLHTQDLTQSQLGKLVDSNGVRIVDLEHYGDLWAAVMVDNVDSETGRLRSIIRASPYLSGYFGAFAKEVAGPTHVGLAHRSPYQPMSVMKLIPHLYLMDRLDSGTVNLDTETLRWTTLAGKPEDVWCKGAGGSTAVHGSSLRETLELSLRLSLNPAHKALIDTYGLDAIVNRVHAMGLPGFQLYADCRPGVEPWRSNTSTLAEIGELFEGVDTRRFFPNAWDHVSGEFYGLMADLPAELFRPIVEQEAAKLRKEPVVNEFISGITLDGKPGHYEYQAATDAPHTTWRAFSYRVAFPARQTVPGRGGGPVVLNVPRLHVGGFFVNELRVPCNQIEAVRMLDKASQECRDYIKAMDETWVTLITELQRTAIHQALETW